MPEKLKNRKYFKDWQWFWFKLALIKKKWKKEK
jgi:hypothetical protein